MAATVTLDAYKKAYREIVTLEERKWFYIHLALYASVNTALLAVNLYLVPNFLWFLIPLGAWGAGVVYHYLSCISFSVGGLERREAEAEHRAREQRTPASP